MCEFYRDNFTFVETVKEVGWKEWMYCEKCGVGIKFRDLLNVTSFCDFLRIQTTFARDFYFYFSFGPFWIFFYVLLKFHEDERDKEYWKKNIYKDLGFTKLESPQKIYVSVSTLKTSTYDRKKIEDRTTACRTNNSIQLRVLVEFPDV